MSRVEPEQFAPEAGTPHLRVLDGVRGLAILVVLFHHLSPMLSTDNRLDLSISRLVQAGWCGVDLFFVLSGFLITGILLRTKTSSGYFTTFYARRVLRIIPLYYGILCFYFLILPHLPHAHFDLSQAPASGWYWSFLANFVFAAKAGTVRPIFEVCWSLCIEEQFYLFWPLLVLLLGRRSLIGVCIAILVVCPLIRSILVLRGCSWECTYMFTPCRLDGLITGALLATANTQNWFYPGRWAASVTAAAPLIVVWLFPACRSHPVGQIFIYSLLAIGFASMLALALRSEPKSLLRKVLEGEPLRVLGRYSYALYLFHGLIERSFVDRLFEHIHFPLLRGSNLPLQILYWLVNFGLSFAAAWLSWNLIEKHSLRLKRFFNYGPAKLVFSSNTRANSLEFATI